MSIERISREELFALVWEKPTREVAEELGVSDVAIGKLCTRLQVPKPPRGYWARVKVGQTPKRPPLAAFREEVDRKRRATERAKAAGLLSKLQLEFYQAALRELRARGIDLGDAEMSASRLPNSRPRSAPIRAGAPIALWNAGRNSARPANASTGPATSPATRRRASPWATWPRAWNAMRRWNPCFETAIWSSASTWTLMLRCVLASSLLSATASAEGGGSDCRPLRYAAVCAPGPDNAENALAHS